MGAPTLTYQLANGTTADAAQVMQDFNDLLNAMTDGTKDFSISALTLAGTGTFNGHVILGSASSDDLTFNGSLASSIPIKTTRTYDIGSADLGLRTAYFGGNSTYTVSLSAPSSGLAADHALLFDLEETRSNSSTVTANGTVLFNWSSLTAGKRYRVEFSGTIVRPDNNGTVGYARIMNNSAGTQVARFGWQAGADGAPDTMFGGVSCVLTLVGTYIAVEWISTDTGTASITGMTCTLTEINSVISNSFGT